MNISSIHFKIGRYSTIWRSWNHLKISSNNWIYLKTAFYNIYIQIFKDIFNNFEISSNGVKISSNEFKISSNELKISRYFYFALQRNEKYLQIFKGIFTWIEDIFKSFENIFKYYISILHLEISSKQYFLFPSAEPSQIKTLKVVRLGQLDCLLIHINLLAYLRTLPTFGKFMIAILFIFSVDQCALSCNTFRIYSSNFHLFTNYDIVPIITRDLYFFVLRAKKSSESVIPLI